MIIDEIINSWLKTSPFSSLIQNAEILHVKTVTRLALMGDVAHNLPEINGVFRDGK